MRKLCMAAIAAAIMLSASSAQAAIQIVNSNNPSPGDSFTNAGPVGALAPVGATGWLYNNVRNNGHVGINTTFARSGNGSAWFQGTQGPGGASSKADIEFYGALGTLGDLTSLSYDWYRASGGTSNAGQHASLRLIYDADGNVATTNDQGHLVYERAYNGDGVTEDTWNTDNVLGANFWMTNFGNANGSVLEIYNRTLNDWINTANPNSNYPTLSASTLILGISSGIGSGWGTHVGAVDNITIGFGGSDPTTYNFEAASNGIVPEPMTFVVWSGLGLCGLVAGWRANRRHAAA